jgi:Cu+-exporting ATPase
VETLVLDTPTATCGSCKAHIQEEMDDVAGVESADLDIRTRRTTVVFDPTQLDEAAVRAAISDAGYPPEN